LSDTTIDIGAGVQVPAIDNRSADTVVVTESGKTVVIGGLIASQKTDQERKVPLLGDIPLLGYAFKRKIKADTKTELLIFMTPTVIQRPGELAQASAREKGKLRLLPETYAHEEIERFVEGYHETPAAEPDAEAESVEDLRQRALEYLRQQEQAQPTEP
jgi:type II secretory pathway component GspD/PulD (secretin)